MLDALSPQEKALLLQSIGTHKKDRKLQPPQVAQLLAKAMRLQPIEDIASDLEMAETSTLRRILSLQRLPAECRPLVVWGGQPGYLSFSVAAELARASDQDLPSLLAAALEERFSKEEVRGILQRGRRSGEPIHRAMDEIRAMRPVTERQYLFMGRLPANVTELGDQEGRSFLRRALAKRFGAAAVLSVACQNGRFSFILSEEGVSGVKEGELSSSSLDSFVERLTSE
jgi:hypothetical protein